MCQCNSSSCCGCNDTQYTDGLVYDGEKSSCDDLNTIVPNKSTLNQVIKIMLDKICTLFERTEGHIIEDEGTPLAQQPTINFLGAGVTATDNPGSNSTDVTIPGGGGSGGGYETLYYFEDLTGINFTLTLFALNTIPGTSFTIPVGKGGTYEFMFLSASLGIGAGTPIVGAAIAFFINGIQYGGQLHEQKTHGTSPNPDSVGLMYTLSNLTLADGDVVDLRAAASTGSTAGRVSLVNTVYKLFKID